MPFSWKDLTPVSRLALDYFNLWVNNHSPPYKTAKDYLDAVKKEPGKFNMGGTGSKQEDQIITVMFEQIFRRVKFSYVPFKGGGEVAVELVGKHIDSSVNNPAEAVSHWKAGKAAAPGDHRPRADQSAGLEGDPDDQGSDRQGHE